MDSVFSAHGAHVFYWCMALFGTTFMVVQLIMMMFGFGLGDHSDIDAASGSDVTDAVGLGTFNLFSIRALLAFITFFGWGGVFWGDSLIGFFVSLACGASMFFITAFILFIMTRLTESGNIKPNDMVGRTGSVYMNIPAGREKHGIVTVSMGSCTREIMALSDIEIKTGATVKITSCLDGKHYLVEKC